MQRRTFLMLTHASDFDVVDRVGAAIERRGHRALRLDLDRYPREWSLAHRIGGPGEQWRLFVGGDALGELDVAGVWVRHWVSPSVDEQSDAAIRDGCVRSAAAAVRGFFESLEGIVWLSEPRCVRDAENKVRQLRAARRVGLMIPRTLVTNHPPDVKAFFDELGGHIVTKMLANLSSSMGRAPLFVRTSRVTAAHLERLDGLSQSPMIFQELVAKQYELRVAFVEGRMFVGRIDAPDLIDWRTASPDAVRWRGGAISDATAAALREFMRSLGLRYGAIDLIRTPDGADVFLEVNPTGEWGMLERDLGLPISKAIADALVGGSGA
mgnify:CR=1 FL=1